MTWQEAADLANSLGPRPVMPTHCDIFAANSCDLQPFPDYVQVKYPDVVVRLPRHREGPETPAG